MAPKKNARDSTPSAPVTTTNTTTSRPISSHAAPVKVSKPSKKDGESSWNFVNDMWNYYWKTTTQQGLMIDIFMVFLVLVGATQFLYWLLGGRFPFNAFLAGFAATVGQFVLTASLRMQTAESTKSEFPKVSTERSFADYIFGSLILHFFCINYIN